MAVESLTIKHVRIISEAQLNPSPTVNLITGENAAGKTSIIEAIDILSRGRSFRTHKLERIITTGQHDLLVAARLTLPTGAAINIGLERTRAMTSMRIHGRAVDSVGELAAHLPVQVLHPDSHQLILGGPAHRRAYVDWGVFHVEQSFLAIWQRYRRAVRQRNAALRATATPSAIRAWHAEISQTGEKIDAYRRDYLTAAIPMIIDYARKLLSSTVELHYRRGWPEATDLKSLLNQELGADMQRGQTRFGPHRAELAIILDGQSAMLTASRGQQKLLAAALRLAQAQLFAERGSRACLFLIDDLPAELERRHQLAVTQALSHLRCQVFITSLKAADVDLSPWSFPRMFHVEQGHIREVI